MPIDLPPLETHGSEAVTSPQVVMEQIVTDSPYASAIDSTIPVLDMHDWNDPGRRGQFVQTLSKACREVGFFAVVNTNIDVDILDKAYATAEEFFQQDPATKKQLLVPGSNGQRGYVLSESAKNTDYKDYKEFLHIGPAMTDEQEARLQFGKNVWPSNMDLEGPMMALYAQMREYMVPLQSALSVAIGERSNFLHEMTEEGDVLMRVLHYPAKCPSNTPWAAAHTDIDLFTILPRSTADGLQVLSPEGRWVDVRVPDGAIIVNVGDMLQNMTNGMFRSSVHQVIDPGKQEERYSIVMFVHPRSPDDMSPRPQCVAKTGGVQRYPNATRIELLAERLADLRLADKGLLQLLGQSGLCEQNIKLGRASTDAMENLRDAGYATEEILKELERVGKGV